MPQKTFEYSTLIKELQKYADKQVKKQAKLMKDAKHHQGKFTSSLVSEAADNTFKRRIAEAKQKVAQNMAEIISRITNGNEEFAACQQQVMAYVINQGYNLLAKGSKRVLGRTPSGLKLIEDIAQACGYDQKDIPQLIDTLHKEAKIYALAERVDVEISLQTVLGKIRPHDSTEALVLQNIILERSTEEVKDIEALSELLAKLEGGIKNSLRERIEMALRSDTTGEAKDSKQEEHAHSTVRLLPSKPSS